MADVPQIHGTVEPGWEGVRDAFANNFAQGLELGASAYITRDGEAVVDIWAGDRAPDGTPWVEDTIVNVYSTTKTMCGISLMMLIDRGLVDPHAPVATYWPEFAANGKDAITVAQVMAHTSRPATTPSPTATCKARSCAESTVVPSARSFAKRSPNRSAPTSTSASDPSSTPVVAS